MISTTMPKWHLPPDLNKFGNNRVTQKRGLTKKILDLYNKMLLVNTYQAKGVKTMNRFDIMGDSTEIVELAQLRKELFYEIWNLEMWRAALDEITYRIGFSVIERYEIYTEAKRVFIDKRKVDQNSGICSAITRAILTLHPSIRPNQIIESAVLISDLVYHYDNARDLFPEFVNQAPGGAADLGYWWPKEAISARIIAFDLMIAECTKQINNSKQKNNEKAEN